MTHLRASRTSRATSRSAALSGRYVPASHTQLQAEQDELERTLDAERRAMIGPHGEHLHGTKYVYGLLTRSGARCQATYARWMWDALRRWDQLRYAQQQRLERLGVPYFFETNERDALAKQQRLLPHLLQHAAPTTS